jgi:formate hydrogenlyase subunit 3/multisubunit Na+/H+ antiporter MnhD subunit
MFSYSIKIFLVGVFLIFFGGVLSLLFWKKQKIAILIGTLGAVLGSILGLIPAIKVLLSGGKESLYLAWSMPFGAFYVEIDAISAFFLLCIFILSIITAIYGSRYLLEYKDKSLAKAIFFFNVLISSMAMVVVSANGMLFLICWEIMSIASFFLVTFEDEHKHVRQAGVVYLIATHIGTAFLLVMFILLGRESNSLDFDKFTAIKMLPASMASIIFILSLIGFGTKAGLVPFHIWLPEAHPAAPSHVSALMSGVMIKTGIYGIIRVLTFLPNPPLWWGWLLIIVGAVSGVIGVLFALAQHDIKRLLAYHSVENIGIITMGLGLGVVGINSGNQILAILGLGGAILHILNHALFKGLLFLGAGSVVSAAGTREIDELGGLGKNMFVTSVTFLIGAVAICGIPPLNGFISEFLIYTGSFKGLITKQLDLAAVSIIIIGSLALIGGLALACFTKVYGIIFLGEPRSKHSVNVRESSKIMLVPMIILAALCAFIGLFSSITLNRLKQCISQIAGIEPDVVSLQILPLSNILTKVSFAAFCLFAAIAVLLFIRKKMLSAEKVSIAPTWDCGYAKPDARMQYTASSFAQPLVDSFKMILRTRKITEPIKDLFPVEGQFESSTPEVSRDYLFNPIFKVIYMLLGRLRWLQGGNIQLYILYIALTLIALIIWKLR